MRALRAGLRRAIKQLLGSQADEVEKLALGLEYFCERNVFEVGHLVIQPAVCHRHAGHERPVGQEIGMLAHAAANAPLQHLLRAVAPSEPVVMSDAVETINEAV